MSAVVALFVDMSLRRVGIILFEGNEPILDPIY